MIIKNLSRTNSGGSGQLVKYIFKYILRDTGTTSKSKKDYDRPLFLPKGVHVTERDLLNLHSEKVDSEILADLKAKCPDGDYIKYIQTYLLPKQPALDNAEKSEIKPFIIKHNVRANSINGFIRTFEENEKNRTYKRSDSTAVHHTIISWSNKDSSHITEKMLRDISREYFKLRGESNLYVGTLHTDCFHLHLHIAMGGTNLEGRSARISKKDFEEVKVKLQQYQIQHFPELSHSLPDHLKSKDGKDKIVTSKNIRPERTFEKASILRCTETSLSLATSTEHFVSLINQSGYTVYYRNSVLTGIQTEQGLKFRFSRLGIDIASLAELDTQRKKEELTLKEIRQLRNAGKDKVRNPIKNTDTKNEKEIESEMDQDLAKLQALRVGRDVEQIKNADQVNITDIRPEPEPMERTINEAVNDKIAPQIEDDTDDFTDPDENE